MKKSLFIFLLALAATHLMAAKVYFINSYGWSTVKAYLWTAGGEMAWPGQDMTKESGMICTKGDVYSIEADSYEFIIFNNGSEQTDDLTIDPARPFWYMEIAYPSIDDIESPLIGNQFVDETSGLKFQVTSMNSVQVINNGYTGNSYIIPTDVWYSGNIFSVTAIGDYAFTGCSGLTSITIPNSVTTIGSDAFESCSGLTSVTIPNSVTAIGDYAFNGCGGLTSVTIGNSVKAIGSSAFSGCMSLPVIDNIRYADTYLVDAVDNKLSTYTIKEGTKWIGSYAFSYCSSLTSITIPNSVTTIGEMAFNGCSGLTSITIPNSVTTIGEDAFLSCSGLKKTKYTGTIADWCKIKFNDNPISCSHNLFINDVEIKDLVIPNGVRSISDNAFYGCSGLTSITIPNSVTTIGIYAFDGCSGLTSITCYATTPPTCGYSCFSNVDWTIPVYVPARSVDAYKQAGGWRDFYNLQGFPNDYAMITCSATNGTIKGGGKYIKGDTCTLTIAPNYGYHFVQWNDGNTDNPRSFVVTQDTTFIAELAINIYSFDVQTADSIMGSVVGTKGNYEHGTSLDVSAQPNYGYHFDHWSDGNKQNPRTFTLTKDTVLTAHFAKNIYSVSASNSQYGSIFGTGKHNYLDTCTLTVIPDFGYNFIGWNDGNTDNPRSLVVTQDTTFTAQIDTIWSGACGDDLTWRYNDGVFVISGTGAMYDYTQGTAPWMPLFKDSISSLVINNGCTSIGNFAFYGLSNKNLKTIDIPSSVEQIGQYAFANCEYVKNVYLGLSLEKISANAFANDERLLYITCYAIEPPLLDESAFVNYDAYLSVPCASLADYKVAKGWKLFNKENVSCIGAEEKPITGDEVTVNPSADNATFTWPQNDQAAGYSIEITKDGVVFCTLTFNAQGQLIGIAFAPNRAGSRMLDAAVMTANGWQFTVTGLDIASKYGYALDALNASKQSIKHYEGEFATDGYTSLEWVISDKIQSVNKMLLDGHLYILRDGNLYTATGARVK